MLSWKFYWIYSSIYPKRFSRLHFMVNHVAVTRSTKQLQKVSCYGKHKHWNRYFPITEIQMNATYSFLASNMPSLCNGSVCIYMRWIFLFGMGAGLRGIYFWQQKSGKFLACQGTSLLTFRTFSAQDTEWYGHDPTMQWSPGQSYEHCVASLFLLGCYWTTHRFNAIRS